MSAPEGYIEVVHGKLTVNVPRKLFTGVDAVLDEKKAAEFGAMLKSRYPWLTDGSLEVFGPAYAHLLECACRCTRHARGNAAHSLCGNHEQVYA